MAHRGRERAGDVAEVGAEGHDHRGTALAAHRDGHVTERDADRRLRLVDGDLDGLDQRPGQRGVRDPGGEGLDQVERPALDEGHDVGGHLGIAHRVGQVVARRPPGRGRRRAARRRRSPGPRAFSCARTPWKPRARTPHRLIAVAHRRRPPSAATTTSSASRLDGHVVHPHPPRPGRAAMHRGRRGRGVALERRRGAPSGARQPAEERLAGGADEHRVAQRLHLVEAGAAAPSCARRAWRTRSPGSSTIGSRRDAAAATRLDPPGQLGAHVRDHVVVRARGAACRGCARASASRRTARRPSATTRGHRGVGQAAADVVDQRWPRPRRAGAATSARIVSTLTRAPAASARTTGSTRRSSSCTVGRSAPGRVDSPPTSSRSAPCVDQPQPVGHRGGRLEPLAAVAEGVGGHVDHAHHDPGSLTRHTLVSRRDSEGQVRNASASSAAMATRGRSGRCG